MSFQTFVRLQNTNKDIFNEILYLFDPADRNVV